MTERTTRAGRIAGSIIALLIVVFYLVVTVVAVPGFADLFEEAELKLPQTTQIVFGTYVYWNIFGLIAIVGASFLFRGRTRLGWTLIVVGGVSILIVLPFLVQAMYAPIFEMEKEI